MANLVNILDILGGGDGLAKVILVLWVDVPRVKLTFCQQDICLSVNRWHLIENKCGAFSTQSY